jgi:hypothetical protein
MTKTLSAKVIFGGVCIMAGIYALIPSSSSVAGTWSCAETNPNGTVSQGIHKFGADGNYASESDGFTALGTFQRSGDDIHVAVTKVSNGSITLGTNRSVQMNIKDLDDSTFNFNSTIVQSGSRRSARCSRLK